MYSTWLQLILWMYKSTGRGWIDRSESRLFNRRLRQEVSLLANVNTYKRMGGGASAATGLTRGSTKSDLASNSPVGKSLVKSSMCNGNCNRPESLQQDKHQVVKKVSDVLVTSGHGDFIDDDTYDDELNLRDYDDHFNKYDAADDDDVIANAELYTHLTTSLDMENEDLLFNLLYFSQKDNQPIGNIGTMFNSAIEETVALHSENNTPYKLKPLPDNVINDLKYEIFNGIDDDDDDINNNYNYNNNNDCLVCRDVIEKGAEIIKIPSCLHSFHKECVSKWFKYQSSCPICRVNIKVDCRECDSSESKNEYACHTICKSDHII